jgi:hypothetical protein
MAYSKFLSKMGGPKAPSAIHGPLGPIFYPIDKANKTAAFFGAQFRAHDLYDCDYETEGEAVLATVDEDTLVNFRPCDVSEEILSLKLGKANGFVTIPS